MRAKNSKHGFTIVELVIVIAVIAILAAVLVPTFSNLIAKANESSARQTAANLLKEFNINYPNVRSFTDDGTNYYVAYYVIARGGTTYYFRYGMGGEAELIDKSDLPTFAGFAVAVAFETEEAIEEGEGASVKLYRKQLSTGEYLYYRVAPADADGSFSIIALLDPETRFWVLSGNYYSLTRLEDITFNEAEEEAEEEEAATTVTDAAGFTYQSDGNGNAGIISYQGTADAVVIPAASPTGEPVTYIGYGAFKNNTHITSVTMGKNIQEIRANAFLNCPKLETVTLNDGIQALKGAAFYYCTGLTSINLPSSLKEIDSIAFKKCQSLASITVPDGCTIGGGAFCNTTDILFANGTDVMTDGTYTYRLIDNALTRELTGSPEKKTLLNLKKDSSIPENQGITTIASYCFAYDYVTSVYLPNSVTTLENASFYANYGLKEITGGNYIKTIGDQAFRTCKYFESITLSDTVESLGAWAFSGCGKLVVTLSSDLTLGDAALCGVKGIVLDHEGTYHMVGDCLVDNTGKVCQSAYDATIPTDASVTTLGRSCFVACGLSGNVVIPNNITELQKYCFGECKYINTVYVGENVETMETDCFVYATSLTSAVLACNLTTLPAWTFGYCSALTEVTLPQSITAIGNYAFYDCTNLATIHYGGTMAAWQAISFGVQWNGNVTNFSVVCSDGTLIYKS